MLTPKLPARLGAEFLGTFWLVFAGCGSAIFAAHFLSTDATPVQLGIGFAGVALAFGLTVLTMAYAVGHVSGGHFNPAVTLGVAMAKRFAWKDVPAYIGTQVVAGLVAGAALLTIASGKDGFDRIGHMAANGYGAHSPGGYALGAVFLAEAILTAIFVYVILGSTDGRAPAGFGPLAIGLCLTLIHLVSIPISNTSVNPARSTGVAFFNGDGAPGQLWLFWVAPIVGALIAGATYKMIAGADEPAIMGEVKEHEHAAA
ncbi:aquaporin Z [Nostocoides vanveenii]|uniref:Aquaporin Z n=1 Tax=Nostocoides vanveenii TaxID=330835 RepID=A0ABN2L6M9_9MICO